MIITAERLKKYGASPKTIGHLEKNHPNGIELIKIIDNPNLTTEDLHWIRKYFTLDTQEFTAYCLRCGIVHSDNFWESANIDGCNYIIKSSNVKESSSIFGSKDIVNSSDVVLSENVEHARMVFLSLMIEEGEKIFQSKNVTTSTNIVNCSAIINSRNVIDSSAVFNSSEIISSKNIHNSHFIQNCENIKHCLFCENLQDAEYCIFNLPVDKDYYIVFEKQYNKYFSDLLAFVTEWPNNLLAEKTPTILPFKDWYKPIPQKFWKWVRTLPNFDSMLIYNITMLPEILVD